MRPPKKDEADDARARARKADESIRRYVYREFEAFRSELEAEALEKQQVLFDSLQGKIQPVARRIESHINRSLNISLAPVLVRLPSPSFSDLKAQTAAHINSLIETTKRTVPVIKRERYVTRRGFCSDDYGTREVLGEETITTYAVAVEFLQQQWAKEIAELTETSVRTTNAVIGEVIGSAIERARRELSLYAQGFLSTIEHEIRQSEEGRSTREDRLHEVTAQRSNLGALRSRVTDSLGGLGFSTAIRTPADYKGKVDFGILTIREDEFQAVLDRFPPFTRVQGRRVYNLHRLELPGGGAYTVAVLRCIEQGNTEALDAARDVLEELEPRWLLVVGIAGGVPSDEYTLGDVIVSTRIVDFSVEAVLQDQGPEFALMGGPVHKDAAAVLANLRALKSELGAWASAASVGAVRPPIEVDDGEFYGDETWQARARSGLARQAARTEPLVMTGAVGSSDRLVKDTKLLASFLLKAARQVLAVEMESAGVHRGSAGRGVPAVAIRGLSDVVGFKRDPGWTRYACHTAAAFTRAFLLTRPIEVRVEPAPRGQPAPTQAMNP